MRRFLIRTATCPTSPRYTLHTALRLAPGLTYLLHCQCAQRPKRLSAVSLGRRLACADRIFQSHRNTAERRPNPTAPQGTFHALSFFTRDNIFGLRWGTRYFLGLPLTGLAPGSCVAFHFLACSLCVRANTFLRSVSGRPPGILAPNAAPFAKACTTDCLLGSLGIVSLFH